MARARLPNGLTPQQEEFAKAVAAGMSLSDAYRAHYTCATWAERRIWEQASKMAAHPKVRPRIAELKAQAAEKAMDKAAISKAEVLGMLIRNAQRMSEDVPVVVEDEDGNTHIEHVPPSPAHIQAANRALELIGKELAMFVDRKEIRTGKLDGMSREELEARALELGKKLGIDEHAAPRRH